MYSLNTLIQSVYEHKFTYTNYIQRQILTNVDSINDALLFISFNDLTARSFTAVMYFKQTLNCQSPNFFMINNYVRGVLLLTIILQPIKAFVMFTAMGQN